jgi:putative flippase GtrA
MKRFFLFGLGSTFGACIDFLVTWLLLQQGLNAFISFALAMSMSATLVYFYHEYLTFKEHRDSSYSHTRLSQFLTSTLLIYAFRVTLFYGLTALQVLEVIAILVALVSSVFINFFVSKLLIFKR